MRRTGNGETMRARAVLFACVFALGCGEPEPPEEAAAPGIPAVGPVGLLETSDPNLPIYDVFEVALGAGFPGAKPWADGPRVEAAFEGLSGAAVGAVATVEGFWDGANVWRLRFAPTRAGDWTFRVESDDPALHGLAGRLSARMPTDEEIEANPLRRGFLQRDGYAWKLSDGQPFFPVGDSQWSFAEELHEPEILAWIDALARLGLNGLHGSVWLARYTRAATSPFAGRDPRSDELQPEYFQRLDRVVRHANANGVIVGLAIGGFPKNSRWYDLFGSRERHERWFRYVVARYAAFNVRWILFGEVDDVAPPWGGTWQESVARHARLVKQVDPWNHPLGSHHRTVDTSSATNPDVDYVEVQAARTEEQHRLALEYRRWGKPLWFEEYWYEPRRYDGGVETGIRNTHRNFVGALAFPTLGSLMRGHAGDPDYPPERAAERGVPLDAYLLENDVGLHRIAEFKRFYAGLDRKRFEPATQRCSRGVCGRFGASLAVVLAEGGSVDVDLRGLPGPFTLRQLSLQSGERARPRRVEGDTVQRIDADPGVDVALLFEKLPEVR